MPINNGPANVKGISFVAATPGASNCSLTVTKSDFVYSVTGNGTPSAVLTITVPIDFNFNSGSPIQLINGGSLSAVLARVNATTWTVTLTDAANEIKTSYTSLIGI